MRIFLMENNKRPLCIIRVTGSRTHDGPRCWWGVEQRELLSIVGGDTERCRRRGGQLTTARERNMLFVIHSPAVTCLGIYPKSCGFIAKNWKQPRYPLVGEWINKL